MFETILNLAGPNHKKLIDCSTSMSNFWKLGCWYCIYHNCLAFLDEICFFGLFILYRMVLCCKCNAQCLWNLLYWNTLVWYHALYQYLFSLKPQISGATSAKTICFIHIIVKLTLAVPIVMIVGWGEGIHEELVEVTSWEPVYYCYILMSVVSDIAHCIVSCPFGLDFLLVFPDPVGFQWEVL